MYEWSRELAGQSTWAPSFVRSVTQGRATYFTRKPASLLNSCVCVFVTLCVWMLCSCVCVLSLSVCCRPGWCQGLVTDNPSRSEDALLDEVDRVLSNVISPVDIPCGGDVLAMSGLHGDAQAAIQSVEYVYSCLLRVDGWSCGNACVAVAVAGKREVAA